jgi:hypothetical protein
VILHPIRPPSMSFCRTAGPRRTQNTFSPRGSKNPAKPKLAADIAARPAGSLRSDCRFIDGYDDVKAVEPTCVPVVDHVVGAGGLEKQHPVKPFHHQSIRHGAPAFGCLALFTAAVPAEIIREKAGAAVSVTSSTPPRAMNRPSGASICATGTSSHAISATSIL